LESSDTALSSAREPLTRIPGHSHVVEVTGPGRAVYHGVKLNNYIVDIGTNIAHYCEVRDRYLNKAAPPASTMI